MKIDIQSEKGFIELARKGVEKKDLIEIQTQADLTLNEFAKVIHVSVRTIQKKRANDRFPPDTSERALYLKKLYMFGRKVFGDISKFQVWMNTINASMGNVKPKTYLDTLTGIQMIHNKLNGIVQGFPA